MSALTNWINAGYTSPIAYFDYSDVSTSMINLGTGGDFTQNGTIAQSGRGPAQYNTAACFFDNSADYMTATGATIGASDSKEFTLSFMAKRAENLAGSQWVIDRGTGAAGRLTVDFGSTNLNITARNSAGTVIFNVTHALSPAAFKWYHIYCAVDLTDSGLFKLEVDGVDVGAIPSTYSNDTINFASTETWRVFQRFNGDPPDRDAYLSCIFLDTNYTGANSFYDTDTGKAKYLGSMGELPTGSQPLIYLPLYGNDAGNNLGSGGDFTVNSGPFTGARGFNEVWADSAEFDGSTGRLFLSTQPTGVSDEKTLSFAVAINIDALSSQRVFRFANGNIDFFLDASGNLTLQLRNEAGSIIMEASKTSFLTASTWYLFLFSCDLTSASNRSFYNGDTDISPTWSTYTNDAIELTDTNWTIGAFDDVPQTPFDGKIGFLWFSTEYIDFSQEENRLKFFDAFNYPVDVGEDGSLHTGTAPILYMNNDFHLGTDSSGNGNDFSVNGTVTDGGQVKG